MRKSILYALAGACAGVLITTTTALAGSGVGGVFNLGQTNTVNAVGRLPRNRLGSSPKSAGLVHDGACARAGGSCDGPRARR
jgi:hypothetical protein